MKARKVSQPSLTSQISQTSRSSEASKESRNSQPALHYMGSWPARAARHTSIKRVAVASPRISLPQQLACLNLQEKQARIWKSTIGKSAYRRHPQVIRLLRLPSTPGFAWTRAQMRFNFTVFAIGVLIIITHTPQSVWVLFQN